MSSVFKSNATEENKASTKNGVKRFVFVMLAMVGEVILDVFFVLWVGSYAQWVTIGLHIIALFIVIYLYNQNKTAAMKMPWIILLLAFPIFGVLLYALIGTNPGLNSMRERYADIESKLFPLLEKDGDAAENLTRTDRRAGNIAEYILNRANYPAYDDSDIEYYDTAAKGLEAQKEELRKAKKFIFMEYHAIENKESWKGIQEILEERVKAGVEVRVFYDDMGSIGFINTDFVKLMESKGIRCRVFNPFKLGLDLFLNNRDHRKITVIDGKVGFTGGYNLANEYFNITHPFGYWKDTGIKITGYAVRNLTVTFLEMWNAIRGDDENDREYTKFLPYIDYKPSEKTFIIPYADIPTDNEHVGEDVYISMAEYAQNYVWYVTPYLILTDEMIHALGLAAKRGVDVRIITPGIPDKPIIYSITRSYYYGLVKNGVRIFEYTPGFCHCKMSVADDMLATCGTINLDYRSLYHHFENGCLYADCKAVMDTKQDFESMFKESCEVTEDYKYPSTSRRLGTSLLRLFAPLL